MTTSMKDIFERFWAHTTNKIDNLTYNWNDLEDKPFGEVSENVVLCYNKSLYDGGFFPDKSGIGEYTNYAAPLPTSMITVGDTYIATFNGVDYVDTARAIEDTSSVNGGIEIFGNFDSGFNDYPITLTSYADHLYFYSKDGKGGEMKLTHVRNSIKQLDEKFIPDTIARQSDINTALAQAKESGEFTPEKGVDYFTEADKSDLVSQVISTLPTWTGGTY